MFGLNQPRIFETSGKTEVSLTMHMLNSWDDHGYGLSMSYYAYGEVEGGHEVTISGVADDYWRGDDEVGGIKLRMHVKFVSDLSRRRLERGTIGGGRFYDQYVDVELNLEPERVRDVINELRYSAQRQVSIGGFMIDRHHFRAVRFGLSGPRESEELFE